MRYQSNPGAGEVTTDDVTFGHLLAEAVNRYAAELDDKLAAQQHAADPDDPAGQAA